MLCLGRKTGEKFVICAPGQPEVWITLIEIRGDKAARIGIEAPRHIEVMREEVFLRQTCNMVRAELGEGGGA